MHFEVPAVQILHAEYRYSKPRYTARLNAKLKYFDHSYNFPLSELAIFLQIFQKCALRASLVHAESNYIAKLVQIDVLIPKNGDEITDA